MAGLYGRENARYLEAAGSANAKRMAALQKALLGYVGGSTDPRSMTLPGGMTFADLGFEGELVPSSGPLLNQAFDYAGSIMGGPEATARTGALQRLMSGESTFNADPALRERFFRESISDPAMRMFNEEISPAIAARYGRGGNIGAASYATAQAGGRLATDLAGQRAGLLRDDEVRAQSARDAALARMAGAVPLSLGNQQGTLGMLGNYGQLERGIRGELNQGRFQEALLGTPFGDPRLGMLGMLGGTAMNVPGQVGAPSVGGGSLSGLLGAAGGLMDLFGGGSGGGGLGGLFG